MTQLIIMNVKELSRYETIKELISKKINGVDAAIKLNLSTRHIRRLKAKVRKYGVRGLIHGNRGRESNRKIKSPILKKTRNILKILYADFGPTFASEKLEESHQIKLSNEKVRQIMIAEKLWRPKPRKENKEYRSWRPRKEYYGEMEQFDGSYHNWFEGRAPECCLLASIDDAKGEITKAKFVSDEGVKPTFSFWQSYVQKLGKPLKIYLDRYSTYKINSKHLFDDPSALTQFERAMMDLDIEVIHARSPQAKGRIEKLFGTLQDRLVKELRLVGISTIEEANEFLEIYLPKFNAKFSVLAQKRKNLHRKLTVMEKENLDKIFSVQNIRIVNNDFTIRYKDQWFQLSETQPTLVLRKDKVLIEERMNGRTFILLRGKYLDYTTLPARPEKVKMKIIGLTKTRTLWKPPANHPWRKQFLQSRIREK